VIGLAFCDILDRRRKSGRSETGSQPYTSPGDPKNALTVPSGFRNARHR
jgi:hypothetical protein